MDRDELYDQIERNAETLNRLAQDANEEISGIEENLKDMGVGISAQINTPIGRIAYGKDTGEWKILFCNEDTPYGGYIPLSKCARQIRMDSLPYLNKLLKAILIKINEEIEHQLKKE